MSALDRAGVDDNTLLIVTSDNGSFMSRLDGLDDRDHTDDSTIQAYRAGNHTANHVYRGTKADIWGGGVIACRSSRAGLGRLNPAAPGRRSSR